MCQNEIDKLIFVCYIVTMEPEKQPFDTAILRKAGLTESQAKGYLALIEHGELSPTQLGTYTGESRTNAYMICDKLVALSLATKKDGTKAVYSPNHPSALETLAERRRKVIQRNEQEVKNNLNALIDYYYEQRDTPGFTIELGREGIEKVYSEILKDAQDLELLRSPHDSGYMSSEFYRKYQAERARRNIQTKLIATDNPRSRQKQTPTYDISRGIVQRVWMKTSQYNAAVEWSVYGDKVSAITFGEQPVALTLYSKEIANSMRQILSLVALSGELNVPPKLT